MPNRSRIEFDFVASHYVVAVAGYRKLEVQSQDVVYAIAHAE
ncbi:MAG: hypothetical protein U5K38_16990 [Woeseiaceae bacterium]|nr:hypothetical protein [Woeseiaceae bacterium]